MRSKNSGFSLIELALVTGMFSLIAMLALTVMPKVMARTRDIHNAQVASTIATASAPASASGPAEPHATTAAVVTGPLVRQFHDVELIKSVQAIDTLPDAQKPKDFASRGDWLYVVTDQHALVNGRWADALCPAFLKGRQKITSGTSLVALRGLLFQRVENKRRMEVKGLELANGQTVDVSACPGVSASRSGFTYIGRTVAFASEITTPR
jgi:hypothetical protein